MANEKKRGLGKGISSLMSGFDFDTQTDDIITKTIKDYEEIYPKRNLPEDAVVTRFAPSPTGFVHMGSLLASFIERKAMEKPLNTKITNREYSITERSNQIKNILKNKKQVEFTDLFDIYSKDYIVITFLSILTMARHQELSITQDKNFGKIMIERVD